MNEDHDEHIKVYRMYCFLRLFMPHEQAVTETILDSFEHELRDLAA